ncbi:MAG: hypothetical protein ACKVP4_03405 [Hyphomicrobium sp.]
MERSKDGNSVYLRVGFWLYEDGSIHMTGEGVKGFNIAVNEDPTRKNGHPTLYRRLANCLRAMGAPAPDLKEKADSPA